MHDHRFSPGQVVARRYRIHRLAGSGAMGEVYRADDTTLGKFVALKVPPPSRRGDAAWWAVLRNEVKIAQQVSHPNVCRVFDLVADEDPPLLTMEYIDGETLAQILGRRVGQLTAAEKVRMAHELCAGLEAIHDQGVVHRDLKPSNVMIDGNGRTVITDFGLADQARAVTDPRSGTLPYMAPEQLAGRGVSERSDLYALGVLLFELFTGRHPLRKSPEEDLSRLSPDEMLARQQEGPVFPEEPEEPLPPDLEAVIRRCLEIGPGDRPASAAEVAAALPGGQLDAFRGVPTPVYRLLVTPVGGLRRAAAWVCLAGTVIGLLAAQLLGAQTQLTQAAVRGEDPAVLEARAREILDTLGFRAAPADWRRGFFHPPVSPELHTVGRSPAPQGSPVVFWYRQSPRPLERLVAGRPFHHPDDPPLAVPGEVAVHLDPRGRLVRLEAVPGGPGPTAAAREPDWRPLFAAAGLDFADFRPIDPDWTPPVFADYKAAWVGSGGGPSRAQVRVEAAAAGGRPLVFQIVEPWAETYNLEKRAEDALRLGSPLGRILAALWFGAVLVGAVLLARRNLRLDTADRPAAFRLAVFVTTARFLTGCLGAHHLPSLSELNLVLGILARALLAGALVWTVYIAAEPVVRRFSPRRTASWVRLIYGRIRDPLVGRDLLVGGLFGLAALIWARLYAVVPGWLGLPAPRPDELSPLSWLIGQRGLDLECEALSGFRYALAMASYALVHAALMAFFAVVGVLLLRLFLEAVLELLRRAPGEESPDPRWWWVSRSATFVLFTLLAFPAAGNPGLDLVAAAGAALLWLTALIRFGFLTAVTATAFAWLLSSHPATLDPTRWAAPGAAVPLVLTLAMALWGFRASILPDSAGDRSPVPAGLLDRFFGAGR